MAEFRELCQNCLHPSSREYDPLTLNIPVTSFFQHRHSCKVLMGENVSAENVKFYNFTLAVSNLLFVPNIENFSLLKYPKFIFESSCG